MLEEHKYYTALLLNCYVKQGGEKLKKLIDSAAFDKNMLDIDTAIEVCKESKQTDCALLLAVKSGNVDQQLRILLEESNYKTALETIKEIGDFDTKIGCLRRFGPQILKNLPEKGYELIESLGGDLITKKTKEPNNAVRCTQQFKWLKEIFVDETALNKRFLDFQVEKDPNCEKEVFHSLIEWHLQDYYKAHETFESRQSDLEQKLANDPVLENKKNTLLELLTKFKDKYDQKHVLMLFEMYQVSEGVKMLCEMLKLSHELMTYYMHNKEYENIMKLCEDYGEQDQNLWIQALTYYVSELNSDTAKARDCIMKILEKLEGVQSISPLLVLEIASKNKLLKFGVLKNYLAKRVNKLQHSIEKNRKSVEQTVTEVDKLKGNINMLRTQAHSFQLQKCAECGLQLSSFPLYHFMCNHSFHEHCYSSEADEKECPKCSAQNQQSIERLAQLSAQANDQEQFFKELREKDKKFDVLAQYFGRGLFSNLSKPAPPKEEEEVKEK